MQFMWVFNVCVCVCESHRQTSLSHLTWQHCLHDSHSKNRWKGLTPWRNPPTHRRTGVIHNTRTSLAPTGSSLNPTMSQARHPLPPSVSTCLREFGQQRAQINRPKSASPSTEPAALSGHTCHCPTALKLQIWDFYTHPDAFCIKLISFQKAFKSLTSISEKNRHWMDPPASVSHS